MFDSVEFTKFHNKDCLTGKNLASLPSNKHPNYEDCSTWCRDRRNCGGFTVYGNICFFKHEGCKNDLVTGEGRTTFLLGGKFIKVITWLL